MLSFSEISSTGPTDVGDFHRSALIQGDNSLSDCFGHCLRAVLHVKLLEDSVRVGLYSALADGEESANLLVGRPHRYEVQYLNLPTRENPSTVNGDAT